MNAAALRLFGLSRRKPLACLFPLLCMALPKALGVFRESPNFLSFQNKITSLDVFPDHFSILPCLGFPLVFLDVFDSFEDR
jgi:hypothetical protein